MNIKNNKALIWSLLSLCIFSCSKESKPVDSEISIQNNKNLVLVFMPSGEPSKQKTKTGFTNVNKPRIKYIDELGQEVIYYPDNKLTTDTLIIETKNDYVSLNHSYFQMDHFSYELMPQDTVIFEYENDKPYLTSKAVGTPAVILNFNQFWRKKMGKENELMGEFYYKLAIPNKTSITDSLFVVEALNNYRQGVDLLDSLMDKHKNAAEIIKLHKAKLAYDMLFIGLRNNFKKYVSLDAIDLRRKMDLRKDSLLYHESFLDFTRLLFETTYQIPRRVGRSESHLNYLAAVDTLFTHLPYAQSINEYLLYTYLKGVFDKYSVEDAHNAYNRFKQMSLESFYTKNLNTQYLPDLLAEKSDKRGVNLFSPAEDLLSLEEIIQDTDIVYIDFWASWCAPCIAAMPDSKRLALAYKDKVKFIYLSTDDNVDKWAKANERINLSDGDNSFLILNHKNSDWLKEIGLHEIPRYLILNQGEVFYENAPGPGTKEIREVFDNLLIKY